MRSKHACHVHTALGIFGQDYRALTARASFTNQSSLYRKLGYNPVFWGLDYSRVSGSEVQPKNNTLL